MSFLSKDILFLSYKYRSNQFFFPSDFIDVNASIDDYVDFFLVKEKYSQFFSSDFFYYRVSDIKSSRPFDSYFYVRSFGSDLIEVNVRLCYSSEHLDLTPLCSFLGFSSDLREENLSFLISFFKTPSYPLSYRYDVAVHYFLSDLYKQIFWFMGNNSFSGSNFSELEVLKKVFIFINGSDLSVPFSENNHDYINACLYLKEIYKLLGVK